MSSEKSQKSLIISNIF